MANYNKKRVMILIRTNDGKEFKYIKPAAPGNGVLVGDYYVYANTTALASTQAFTDFGALKALVTAASEWIDFDVDTTNKTLNYYTSEDKDTTGGVLRPRRMLSIRKAAITSIEIIETAYNDATP